LYLSYSKHSVRLRPHIKSSGLVDKYRLFNEIQIG